MSSNFRREIGKLEYLVNYKSSPMIARARGSCSGDPTLMCEESRASQLLVLLVFKPRKGFFFGVVSSWDKRGGGQFGFLGC